jgi:hypothetical protein
MKPEEKRSIRNQKKRTVFKECVMCGRLVPACDIQYLETQIPTGQFVQAPVCKLCIVDPNKTRFYIAQQRKKK